MTSRKTRRIVATLAGTAALAIVPAAAEAAYSTSTAGTASTYDAGATSARAPQRASETTPTTGTHTSPTSSSTIRVSEAYSSGQEGSAGDEWCEQAADLANYYHDRAIDGYIAGSGEEFYDKNMAVSDDIANQAENAGCVVVY
ncbi:MAG: hypothetical protein Q8K79_21155 [Solirubrobacteraceae bacterium]|nr:hypothetical protein [Solirubrobacteraceae bacterium]